MLYKHKNMRYLILILLFSACQKDDTILPQKPNDSQQQQNAAVAYKYRPIVDTIVDDFLAKPATGAKLIVPVIIIDIIPTDTNGVLLESVKAAVPDYADRVVSDLNKNDIFYWTLNNNQKTKFAIEEGSKFRGYNDPSATPYVGIKVVKYFKVQNLPLVYKNSSPYVDKYTPDYKTLFDSIGLKNLVESYGVKEVWINYPQYIKNLYVYESNMSSPYGDVSNSYRDADLPVYNKTYVVYGNMYSRWFGEMIHCRGHQIEAQLGAIDSDFFWKKFVGGKMEGRCGDTHHTPNSTGDYDYDNGTPNLSDISSWNPNGGTKAPVSKTNWKKNRPVPFGYTSIPKHVAWNYLISGGIAGDPQTGWLVYWFQSIPSEKKIMFDNTKTVDNWWDIFYNWDETMKNKKKLYN